MNAGCAKQLNERELRSISQLVSNVARDDRDVSIQGEQRGEQGKGRGADQVKLCRRLEVPVRRMEITGEVSAVFLTVIVWCASRTTETKNSTRWQICNF